MIPNSQKAQTTIISAFIILIITLFIVALAFNFGLDALNGQESRTKSDYFQSKLLEIKRDIREVVHEGVNATRTTRIDLRDSKLIINETDGSPCNSNSLPDSNGIMVHFDSDSPIVSGGTGSNFILVDSQENNSKCTAEFQKNESGVLLLKSNWLSSGGSRNTYFLWFRDLENKVPATSETYSIDIQAQEGASEFSNSIFTITVKNVNTNFDTGTSTLTSTINVSVN